MSRGLLLMVLTLAGCTPARVDPPTPPPQVELGAAFDPADTGTIRGQVTWRGPLPALDRASGVVPDGDDYRLREVANPFAPVVDPATSGLAGVLVQFDGIDPTRSRPWDHPPVTLAMANFGYRLTPASGIVRVGDNVASVSRDPELHVVRARGADFFSLTFPAPDQPRTRRFDTPGIVELTSGAGYFWNAVDLYVRVDPYASVTDAQGNYELPQVPAGTYALTFRVRNPKVTRVERDPETGLPFRHFYAAAGSRTITVGVTAGRTLTLNFATDTSIYTTGAP